VARLLGPSAAVRRYQHHLTAPTERTPSRASASNGHGFVATMIEGGLEGLRSLAAAVRRYQDRFTAPTEGRPPGHRPTMAMGSWQR
jgi:hypothetical protein